MCGADGLRQEAVDDANAALRQALADAVTSGDAQGVSHGAREDRHRRRSPAVYCEIASTTVDRHGPLTALANVPIVIC